MDRQLYCYTVKWSNGQGQSAVLDVTSASRERAVNMCLEAIRERFPNLDVNARQFEPKLRDQSEPGQFDMPGANIVEFFG